MEDTTLLDVSEDTGRGFSVALFPADTLVEAIEG